MTVGAKQLKLRTTDLRTLQARKKVYLASPYSHSNPAIREDRYQRVSKVAGELIEFYSGKKAIFCPIAHTVSIAAYSDLDDLDWEEFMDQDLVWLSTCDELYVLQLKGWEKSKGVRAEIKFAERLNIPITYFNEQLIFCNSKGVELVRKR